VFDKRYGTVTAGNASPLTDGASAVLLMSEEKAAALGYKPLGFIRSYAYAALAPDDQLLQGPVYAAPGGAGPRGAHHQGHRPAGDPRGVRGAGALQPAVVRLGQDRARAAGARQAIGIPPEDRINVMGGSIAIGHPFGATGGRITVTLLNELRRRGEQFGMISVCAAGAMGFVMIVEAAPS
jgi:acetyl-CoA acyltransferase